MNSTRHTFALWLGCVFAAACGEHMVHGNAEESAVNELGSLPAPVRTRGLDFIKIEAVQESDATGLASLTGRVTFDEDHTQRVASPIDGRVTAVLVEPGRAVKAGQRIIDLSSPDVGRLQSDAQKAMQDLSVAARALQRVQELRSAGAVSEKELVSVEADFKKAKSEARRNEAQLAALGISASDPTVQVSLRAQIAGTVVSRSVLVGQEVRADATAPLVTITNLDEVWVLADVYEQDLGTVETGDTVIARAAAYPDAEFTGEIAYVGDVIDAQSRTVKLRCVFKNSDHRLKPEMFVNVEVRPKHKKRMIEIPSRAVVTLGPVTKAIVVLEGNEFQARKIEVGPEHDGKVRLLAGLQPGERIVTDGALFLEKELR